jgi:UDP-glucose 4-epimerase
MKTMVTGAKGFVGGHLCRRLESEGLDVVQAVRSPQAGAIAVGSISGETDWSAALQGVSVVVHLAARAHILRETVADPLAEFRKVNVDGALNLAQQAAGSGVKRFVFISSIGVNGLYSSVRPFSVYDEPRPHNDYAISKFEAEQGLKLIASKAEMELVIIRSPLVYGSGVGANFLRLMKLAGSGIPLPLGAVKNVRSLVYVGNLCDLIFQCLENPKAIGQTFFVSDDQDVSTLELLKRLAFAMEKKTRLFPMSGKLLRLAGQLTGHTAEVERLCGSLQIDISRTKQILGWNPPFSMEEGIRRTIGVKS